MARLIPLVLLLADLARRNPLGLAVWGENTGRNDRAAMARCFERIRSLDLMGIVWAFEPELFDGRYASLSDLEGFIWETPRTFGR